MKKVKYIIIGIVCICIICAGFFFFSQKNKTTETQLTEVEKLTLKDLDESYPKTPREVIKLYNRIVSCFYGEELTDDQLSKLVDQMLAIMDEDLLVLNPREEYYESVVSDIALYESQKKKVVSTDVCDSNEVKYYDNVKEDTSVTEKLAYVNASYFLNTDGQFAYSYQQFVLRQDANGKWKILTFYEIEGDTSGDE